MGPPCSPPKTGSRADDWAPAVWDYHALRLTLARSQMTGQRRCGGSGSGRRAWLWRPQWVPQARGEGQDPLIKVCRSDSVCKKQAQNMGDLFWLSEARMARLEPFRRKSVGMPRVDDRRALSGIIFINRSGLRWRDAAAEYDPPITPTNGGSAGVRRGSSRRFCSTWPPGATQPTR